MLYEGYASEVENMRNTLFKFHEESCPTLPPTLPKLPRYKPIWSPTLLLLFYTPRQLQRCLSDACAQTRKTKWKTFPTGA